MPLMKLPAFAAELSGLLAARGTERVDTAVIQPAEPFLDMAGEDLRRRIFMTESETGASLCLRPEFTIPVCLRHIETATGTPRRYSYLGEVFRQRRDGPNEFYQAGIEDLGDAATDAADSRAIGDALDILAALLPGRTITTILGDQAVFEAVVGALGLPSGWQKRLIHAFGNMAQLETWLTRLAEPQPVTGLTDEVRGLLEAGDEAALIGWIDRTMAATGYSTNASRSPEDIARRLKQKLALAETRLDPGKIAVLRRFLSLSVPLSEAPAALDGFAAGAGLDLGPALQAFRERVSALTRLGVDAAAITYRAAFGRPLDYYTGLVFEMTGPNGAVLAGGGRFDRLLTLLGAERAIPAVGFALWLDRIETARATGGEA
ncbi:ATP phosphoribosyltransferase regulatory subunit [Gellertiella hungarica]|uniref:ATP phosphoribosyltransferase regulatory subunit n=1 Tax=Gellertiella hungarica TaxID=1572859 RepID=A0A7W6J5C2_9HYPH|nr:ATP phosphoribosyltransferase regulatory subunit [Gellertiella hungarica]MBB4064292.1 ATP phosphoribosyltransferase regulatory subunit [Gellertiella hungarica]